MDGIGRIKGHESWLIVVGRGFGMEEVAERVGASLR